MTKKYCNRCGEMIPDILEISNEEWKKRISNPVTLPCSFVFAGQSLDFCSDCVNDFRSFLEEKNHD